MGINGKPIVEHLNQPPYLGSSTASVRRCRNYSTCTDCTGGTSAIQRTVSYFSENDYFNQIYYEKRSVDERKVALAGKYHLGGSLSGIGI